MLSSKSVTEEGFMPLKRIPTEPTLLPTTNKSFGKRMSFAQETGEQVNTESMWENAAWNKLEKAKKGMMTSSTNTYEATDVPTLDSKNKAIGVVDPFSSGANLAAECAKQGFEVIKILSIWDSPVASMTAQNYKHVNFCATVQHDDADEDQKRALDKTIEAIKTVPYELVAILPGAETGVELADQLSFNMGLRNNGLELSNARRNKYHMGEAVRSAGIRAVKQRMCYNLADLHNFLQELEELCEKKGVPFKSIVKPVQSAGSDDVFLCLHKDEAVIAFNRIAGKRNGVGIMNKGALVQEFLTGKEYVVDSVSRDGVHKIIAVWEYDKRPINGAAFVYFGTRLCDSTTQTCQDLIQYSKHILNALHIHNGPSHMEVMYSVNKDGKGDPCLVEVGSRCHGGEGFWVGIEDECAGYNQITVTIDAYTNGKLFDSIEPNNYPLRKHGAICDIIGKQPGIIRSLPGEEFVRALESFRMMNWEVEVGNFSPVTIDMFTGLAMIQMVNDTHEGLMRDYNAVHNLKYPVDYSLICPVPPVLGAVVVVDPFSTGANLAAMAARWGYQLILVFSEKDSPMASFVEKGATLKPTLLIQHDNHMANQEKAIAQTLKIITDYSTPVLAIMPGAETGVKLAEILANRFKTRGNGETHLDKRRDKRNMQDCIAAAGLRSIPQKLCRTEAEVTEFFNKLTVKKAVLKPNESAGSDGVHLCNSIEECLNAFHSINGCLNGLGNMNDGALMQEFIEGKEYVVDAVSRDGIYKVAAIWEYDKRPANGCNFVYYGMRLLSAKSAAGTALVKYAKEVVEALHIEQGPSHMEVIICADGPCLVEVGCRCHGGEGSWVPIANECVGYNQLEMVLDCYLRPDRFDALPDAPTTLRAEGQELHLVSTQEGIITATPGIDEILTLQSFRRLEMQTQIGAHVIRTVDCFSRPGSVQLVHTHPAQVIKDYEYIRELEAKGLFVVEPVKK